MTCVNIIKDQRKKKSQRDKIYDLWTEYKRALWFINRRDLTEKVNNSITSREFESGKKQTKLAVECRTNAEQLFENGHVSEAFEMLKQSLKHSSKTDASDPKAKLCNTMAAAHATRAKMFLSNKNYEMCLNDAALALSSGCPENLRHIVYLTMGQAKMMQDENEASVAYFEKALVVFELYCDVDESVKTQFTESLSKKIAEMKTALTPPSLNKATQTSTWKDGENGWVTKCVCGLTSCGNQLCSIKDVAECRFTNFYGRGLFAKRAFRKGDVVFVDRSWTTVLGPKYMDSRCQYCLSLLESFCVPCDFCSQVLFCSKTCKGSGWKQFHKFECGLLDTLHDMGNAYRVAYRLFSMTSLVELKNAFVLHYENRWRILGYVHADRTPEIEGDLTADQYTGYNGLYSIMENMESYDQESLLVDSQLLHEMCYKLLRFYEKKLGSTNEAPSFKFNLFGSGRHLSVTTRAVRLSALVRHVMQCQNNGVMAAPIADPTGTGQYLGPDHNELVVSPLGALVNHSCSANMEEHYVGEGKMVYLALTDIEGGDELTKDYRPYCCVCGPDVNFSCRCCLCMREWAKISSCIYEEDFGIDVLICEFCSACFGCDELSNSVLVCTNCCKDDHNGSVAKVALAYEVMRTAYSLRADNKLIESIEHFEKCREIRGKLKNFEKSGIIYMSVYYIAKNLKEIGKFGDASDYMNRLLSANCAFPHMNTYVNKSTIQYIRLKQLLIEFKSSIKAKNIRYANRIQVKLDECLSCLRSVDWKYKTSAQRRHINSVPMTIWLTLKTI